MRIGLDFGGVVANHLPIKMDAANSLFGLKLAQYKEATRTELVSRITKEQYDELTRCVGVRTLDFPIFPNVREVLEKLVLLGDTFHIVSTQVVATEKTLQQYISEHHLPITDITVVRNNKEKFSKCRYLKLEAFIDDSIAILESLTSLNIPLVLADFSTESGDISSTGFTTIYSWGDFLNNVRPLFS